MYLQNRQQQLSKASRCLLTCFTLRRLASRVVRPWSGIWRQHLPLSTLSNVLLPPSNQYETTKTKVDIEQLFKCCFTVHGVKKAHALLVVLGSAQTIYVKTRLLNLYAHLGDLRLVRKVFDCITSKDAYSWNSMISAYVRNGRYREALNCFSDLIRSSQFPPDNITFPPVLKACQHQIDGMKIHCCVIKMGFVWDVFVAATLIHMYSRFGFVSDAEPIFKNMPYRDSASWNAMIRGYCLNETPKEALNLVRAMITSGMKLDPVTVASILPTCAKFGYFVNGLSVHLYVIKHGLDHDVFVCNALINMYAKFGYLELAQEVFDLMSTRDIVSWNSIIAAYEKNDNPTSALRLFREMQRDGFQPDVLTLVSLASSIAQLGDRPNGRLLHGFIHRRAYLLDNVIMGNAILDMYGKLAVLDYAHNVFRAMPLKDIISWNTLIAGYSQNGFASEAIDAFCSLEVCREVIPDQGTWASVLPACAQLGALRQGIKIHGHIIKTPLHLDTYVRTCLIDMYGKCGRVDDALSLFYEYPVKNSVSWNAVILCHGIHGYGGIALRLFDEMLREGVAPDHVTFLSLLSACSHAGLVDEGQRIFRIMVDEYGIKPSLRHYGCMVDLLGRAGLLEKAYDFIKSMSIQPDASIWGALVAACRKHGNVEMAKFASIQLFSVDSENVGYYVLMSNVYANAGKWEGVNEVRSVALSRGLKKTPGWSSIEVNNKFDVFYTGNKSHPASDQIYRKLHILTEKVKSLGYVPDHSFVLQDVEEDEKDYILSNHSERLAIIYGLIRTPLKSTIMIFKNLRVCGDCHNWTKLISKVTERDIVVRDSNRFHHFRDGVCSCGDYW